LKLKSSPAPSHRRFEKEILLSNSPLVVVLAVLRAISSSGRVNEAFDFVELRPDESDSSADLACPNLDLRDEFT
jgi:hypothetical protein